MSKVTIAVVTTLLGTMVMASTMNRVPIQPQPEAIHTRGPSPVANLEWEATLARLQQEDSTAMFASLGTVMLMQIHVDGSIPLWGVIVLLGSTIVTAVGAVWRLSQDTLLLRQQVATHVEQDGKQFADLSKKIDDHHSELRQDIARLK